MYIGSQTLMKEYDQALLDYGYKIEELVDKEGNLALKYTTEGLHISDLGYLKITKVLYKYLNN